MQVLRYPKISAQPNKYWAYGYATKEEAENDATNFRYATEKLMKWVTFKSRQKKTESFPEGFIEEANNFFVDNQDVTMLSNQPNTLNVTEKNKFDSINKKKNSGGEKPMDVEEFKLIFDIITNN